MARLLRRRKDESCLAVLVLNPSECIILGGIQFLLSCRVRVEILTNIRNNL
jgi:hypothetical protein